MNDLACVENMIQLLSRASITDWLFGGWAEELSGLTEPRDHHDVDLLVQAESVEQVDAFIAGSRLTEIPEKHMPHKRAILLDDVVVEIVLVQRDRMGLYTVFFEERWDWPSDTFTSRGGRLPSASRSCLVSYRAGWGDRPHFGDHV